MKVLRRAVKGSIATDIILIQRKREFIQLSCRDNGVLFGKEHVIECQTVLIQKGGQNEDKGQ